jgi:2-polyprenyl-3-methyl-5-hydroxy-6-metoxy-1,4-benzoquinol methylase
MVQPKKSNSKEQKIETKKQTKCYLCNRNGTLFYQNLKDYLFNVSGEWNIRKCSNQDCGLVWLDPQPITEHINKIYQNYYTHNIHSNQINSFESTQSKFNSFQMWLYDLFTSIIDIKQEREQFNQMYLNNVKPGKLLDVGCGNGYLLSKFKDLGWDVQGQDIDPQVKAFAAENYNLIVHLGSLENINFADNTFDAILMNHVVEHIQDPISLLSECYRILKPEGILVATTPNILSTSHQFFGQYWRGLEPPRHLHLFSDLTLKKIAHKAGFTNYQTWTTAAHGHYFALSSLELKKYNFSETNNYKRKSSSFRLKLQVLLFQIWAKLVYSLNKSSGDECVLKAVK